MLNQAAADLLLDHLDLLADLERSLPVLDLACGTGRNGLALAEQGITVVFADQSSNALKEIEKRLEQASLPGRIWQVDLEQPGSKPMADLAFAAIIGFRYLHRPLFPALKSAVMPGGLVVYETFTTGQRRYGRPNNPDFLLQPGELEAEFQHWEIIYHYEGVQAEPERCVAQIVARKPEHFSGTKLTVDVDHIGHQVGEAAGNPARAVHLPIQQHCTMVDDEQDAANQQRCLDRFGGVFPPK